jgi:hypothetical protein
MKIQATYRVNDIWHWIFFAGKWVDSCSRCANVIEGCRHWFKFLNLCTRWRWVTCLIKPAALTVRKSSWYPLYRRLIETYSQSGQCEKKVKIFFSAGNRTQANKLAVRPCTAWATSILLTKLECIMKRTMHRLKIDRRKNCEPVSFWQLNKCNNCGNIFPYKLLLNLDV